MEYAYRSRGDYQAVLWAQAETRENLTSSYLTIATLLNLPEKSEQESARVIAAVKVWLQRSTGWLLILDNADDLALARDFLPLSMGGHLLLTTRAHATGSLAHRLEVEVLSQDQGALFLLRRAGLLAPTAPLAQAPERDQALARAICDVLGGLPLALDQAGAYVEETGYGLADYRQLYQQHRADLLRERGGLVTDHPVPVATTWSLSFQKVEEKNPAAAELLQLCTFLAPDAIPEEIITQGASFLGPQLAPVATDAYLLGQAIEALRAYSLVARNSGAKTLSIHRLVQAVLADSMEQESRQQWAERAVLAINAAFPSVEHASWPQCERLLPHALVAAQLVEQEQITRPEAALLLNQTASYLYGRARYTEAEPLYQRALSIREQLLGPEHPDMAQSLNDLALLYQAQGRYTEAEPLYQRALSIREQQLGAQHPDTATSLNNLAGLYRDQGKYEQAKPLYLRALEIYKQQLEALHPNVAYPLNGLAELYREQGKYVEAEPLCQQALAICEHALGSQHPTTQRIRANYARLLRTMGHDAEAAALDQP